MYTLHVGDALAVLKTLPSQSVHCCVTSPPYWGLRDYGVEGQLGFGQTLDEYIDSMVAVFAEVHRVLVDDGTLWLNLGDSYTSGGRSSRDQDARCQGRGVDARPTVPVGLKEKDLVGVPWRVAFALQAWGWYLRQDIIWAKPAPMPESCRDRCTKAHEYLFLLSRSPKYFYDRDAIAEPAKTAGKPNKTAAGWDLAPGAHGAYHRSGRQVGVHAGNVQPATRNARSVWEIPTQPFKAAHFATFPEALARRCIEAGTSLAGHCPECGKRWKRSTGLAWEASCACIHPLGLEPRRDVVLDPFFGAGTTGVAAKQLRRECVGIELNPAYAALAAQRIDGAPVDGAGVAAAAEHGTLPLLDMIHAEVAAQQREEVDCG